MYVVLPISIQRQEKMVDRQKTTLSLRIDPVLKAAAEKAAADERRSLTSLIEHLLDRHLKAGGYLPLDEKLLREMQAALRGVRRSRPRKGARGVIANRNARGYA